MMSAAIVQKRDHIDCIRSRKSTTGTVLRLGKNAIRIIGKSQAIGWMHGCYRTCLLFDQNTVSRKLNISILFSFLWVQEVVTSGRAKLYKKPTADMLADLFTKPLEA